jgi:hypothetical protein
VGDLGGFSNVCIIIDGLPGPASNSARQRRPPHQLKENLSVNPIPVPSTPLYEIEAFERSTNRSLRRYACIKIASSWGNSRQETCERDGCDLLLKQMAADHEESSYAGDSVGTVIDFDEEMDDPGDSFS